MRLLILTVLASLFTGCAFTESALQYSYEGTKRVESGYKAKAEMTKYLTEYLIEANKDCGVKVEILDGKPVTTVKECIRPSDVMASVDKVEMIKPQKVKSMTDSAGDFIMKATNLAVPVASIYYGFRSNEVNQEANVAIQKSNNDAQTSMWSNYTAGYENTTVTETTDTSVTETTTEETTNEIPNINIDGNTTTIGM